MENNQTIQTTDEMSESENSIYQNNRFYVNKPEQKEVKLTEIIAELARSFNPKIPLWRTPLPALFLRPISSLEQITEKLLPSHFLSDDLISVLSWKLFNCKFIFGESLRGAKPYNPILGEVFLCSWGKMRFFAQQVSHHPPISAFHCVDEEIGVEIFGVVEPKLNFSFGYNTLNVKLNNYYVRFGGKKTFIVSEPLIQTTGFFIGKARTYFTGDVTVECMETGMMARYSNEKQVGEVLSKDKKRLFSISGSLLSGLITITKEGSGQEVVRTLDVPNYVAPSSTVTPVHLQKDNESRKVWHFCSKALVNQDMESANLKKYEVEEKERAKRKLNEANKVLFVSEFFDKLEETPEKVKEPFWMIKKEYSTLDFDEIRKKLP